MPTKRCTFTTDAGARCVKRTARADALCRLHRPPPPPRKPPPRWVVTARYRNVDGGVSEMPSSRTWPQRAYAERAAGKLRARGITASVVNVAPGAAP